MDNYLEKVNNVKSVVTIYNSFTKLYKLLFDTEFLKKKINIIDDISVSTERTIHSSRGYWAKCKFETDGHYNLIRECDALIRLSYGTSSNALSALAVKLFYNGETYDIITNNFNISDNSDFHSIYRTNVFFNNAPLLTLIASNILRRSFSRTGKEPNIFDVSHLSLDNTSGVPETLFFKYSGSASKINEIKTGDVFDIHSGDGVSVGRKIGVLTVEEDVYNNEHYDNVIMFKHFLRKTNYKSHVPVLFGYISDVITTIVNKYISINIAGIYNWLYLLIKPKDPDMREQFPSNYQQLPQGIEEISDEISVPIPYNNNRMIRRLTLMFMKLFNSLPVIRSDITENSEKSQISINYLVCKRAVEKFLLNGPGISSLERYGDIWKSDLKHYHKYNVKDGYQKYGCCIYTTNEIITSIDIPVEIINDGEKEYKWVNCPPDDLYALRVVYATLVMHTTMFQHLALDHMKLANNLALYVEETYNNDFFSKFGKLTTFGTFDINYNGAPVLILNNGIFDRLFAFDHENMVNVMKDANLLSGIYTFEKLNNLPETNLSITLIKLLEGPYLDLTRTIVEKSEGRDWSLLNTNNITNCSDISTILAIHFLHVTIDHYLVGRLENFTNSRGFRSTIPKLGNIYVSRQEKGLINLTLELTYRESLDLCNDMLPYFKSLDDMEAYEIWTKFTSSVKNIVRESNICPEQVTLSIDI